MGAHATGGNRVVAVLPAHDEEASIALALGSLAGQSVPPDAVYVVADNCTDGTADIATAHGATVLTTEANVDKKAGALNQALGRLLPQLDDDDLVLVMDADSLLGDDWIATALRALHRDPAIGAVGGIFYGEGGAGMLAQLQRNEYVRYARDVLRRGRGVWVLTGTSTMLRVSVLRRIAEERGRSLPGRRGEFYDRAALTEDMEITLACLRLGYRCVSPGRCATTTELMPTWRDLWRQRVRWQRGAIDNLRAHGVNRTTLPYLSQQLWALCGFAVIVGYPLLFGTTVAMGQPIVLHPFWLGLGALCLVDRLVTVRKAGWRGMGLTLLFVPEMIYDFFRLAVYVAGWRDAVLRRTARWHHVARPSAALTEGR
ncbi:family 2 glycosyl transferase [Prauserella flavalba]|uniref:Family 2 glycosyl transferase n=1 Tax=Prauserella flavalba TaxID=1477506 RepID=A0A318LM98_9PSEU|nr:family 2 glycosyl transferase [Prauserella flavalba]